MKKVIWALVVIALGVAAYFVFAPKAEEVTTEPTEQVAPEVAPEEVVADSTDSPAPNDSTKAENPAAEAQPAA